MSFNGNLVRKGGPKDIRLQPARSDLPCPMLVSDIMDAAEHVDGKFYTSKSGFRAVTKANGLIEVGNDSQRFNRPKRPDRDKAIEASIHRPRRWMGARGYIGEVTPVSEAYTAYNGDSLIRSRYALTTAP